MSLLVSLATLLQSEGCVAVESVEINFIITQFESTFFSFFLPSLWYYWLMHFIHGSISLINGSYKVLRSEFILTLRQ
jgi:hypothetical protein